MNGRAVELALRRQRLILRSERLRSEIRVQARALEQRLAGIDRIAGVARRVLARPGLVTLASTLLYFAQRRGSMRFLGKSLMWVTMARRALSLYRAFVPKQP